MRSIFFFIFIAAVITGNGQNSGGHSVRGIEFPERESSKLINYTYTVISTMNHTWCYDIYKEKKNVYTPSQYTGNAWKQRL